MMPTARRTGDAVVREGDPAPDFTLRTDAGEEVTLSSLRGRTVILYFYPKDDTPGCTVEACGFRDAYSEFEERGVVVLGVSPDDEASHTKFKQKFSLPFTLLADPEHKIADEYGVWGEKKFGGKSYWGVKRSTFVIDAEGNVARVMHNVKPDGHPEQVLMALP
jgi:peroxiredoxin Q/BCP